MEEHLSQIRAAFAAPSDSSKQAALLACQALCAALEGLPSLEAKPAASAEPSPAPEPPRQQEPAPELCDTSEVPLSRETLEAAMPRGEPPSTLGSPGLPQTVPGVDPAAIAALVATLRSLTPDQWLDLIISKLRGAVAMGAAQQAPAATPGANTLPGRAAPAVPAQALRFQLVTVPRPGAPGGNAKR